MSSALRGRRRKNSDHKEVLYYMRLVLLLLPVGLEITCEATA